VLSHLLIERAQPTCKLVPIVSAGIRARGRRSQAIAGHLWRTVFDIHRRPPASCCAVRVIRASSLASEL